MIKRSLLCVVLLCIILGGCATRDSQSHVNRFHTPQKLSFALIGDVGYRPEQEPLFENMLTELNQTPLDFVVHDGDLASTRFGACTDDLWSRRLAQFQASVHPFIYTPGDNEWTDCHEGKEVSGYEPLERLTRLRTVFFPDEQSLGRRKFTLTRQSQTTDPVLAKYRENARWTVGGITFMTVHVVGSNNGLGRTPEGDAEYAERNTANLAWLRQGFAHARANNSLAIMIIQQANIFPDLPPFHGKPDKQPSGFTELRALLERETIAFAKPVVLVHGDSHFFRIDKPFGLRGRGVAAPAVENFTRVETFGQPNHHWVQVTVDADDPQVFTFRQRIVASNVARF